MTEVRKPLPTLKNLALDNKRVRRSLRVAHRLKELFPEHQEIDAKNFVIEKAAKFGLDLIGQNFDAKNPGVATVSKINSN